MNTIRAKFKCETKTINEYSHVYTFSAAYSNDPNENFFKTTPNGNLSITVVPQHTDAEFEVGKYYFLDFSDYVEASKEKEEIQKAEAK